MSTLNSADAKSNNNLKFFIKTQGINVLVALISATFSASVIAYVLSKLFIRSYIDKIGFEPIVYDAFVDTATISPFFFSILAVIIGLLLSFVIVPAILRYFYHDSMSSDISLSVRNESTTNFLFKLSLFIPSIIILIFIIKGVFHGYLFLFYFIIPIVAYGIIVFSVITNNTFEKKSDKLNQLYKHTFNCFMYSTSSALSLFPLLTLIQVANNSELSETIAISIASILWLGYTLFTGFRVTDNKPVQYFIDFSVAFLIVAEILILSPVTILTNIANFSGVSDKTPRFYQISKNDFTNLENKINVLWQDEKPRHCSYVDVDSQDTYAKAQSDCYLQFRYDDSIYFNAKVVYRNSDNLILCPPNYTLGKQGNHLCFIADRATLAPTAFTTDFLLTHAKLKNDYSSWELAKTEAD